MYVIFPRQSCHGAGDYKRGNLMRRRNPETKSWEYREVMDFDGLSPKPRPEARDSYQG